jgi:Domain of unknown function (DUF4249)
MNKVKYLMVLVFAAFAACKKPYNPPISSSTGNYLVVEGVLNSGPDSTVIRLSRTVKLSNNVAANPELHAVVAVQGDQNISYPLVETGNGNYACAGLNLDNTHQYRLSIATTDGKQYLSDYQTALNSPPIDSVNYDTKGTLSAPGLNIYVNTHDPANKVQYYRWDYQETWIIHSYFESAFKSNGDTVLGRDLINDNIFQCWQSDTSNVIVLGSSAKLSTNVITNNPITSIVSTSEKLGFEYSILVRQYALTADAYNFYTNLKKNTEQLGSIFDAEPSQINGNIHCVTNPAEPVIGYVSVGLITSQRIFISNRILPAWMSTSYDPSCALSMDPRDPAKTPCCYYNIKNSLGQVENEVNEYINYNIGMYPFPLIPVDAISQPGSPPIGYTASTPECTDCTLRGTNKQPAFWKFE